MHIEPGIIAQTKILAADATLAGVLAWYGRALLRHPIQLVRVLIAALFFSFFMQVVHVNVGPSELHFVGAMPIYLTLGFLPTLFGFALGLLLQGLLFEPSDLVHLAVNSLSLILPLITVHYTLGRALRGATNGHRIDWRTIVKLDSAYYGGVTLMVGFWLLIAEVNTPFAAWATFAASYLMLVAIEPILTYASLQLIKHSRNSALIRTCFAVDGSKAA
jgi:ABC-type Co2+ transport system permease subunit